MALRNAFENLSLESTQNDILTAVEAVQAAVEGTLGVSEGLATESTLTDLVTANHTDLAAILAAVDGLEGKDFATQTTLAEILVKLIPAPATEAKQDLTNTKLDTLVTANHTDLAAILAKNEAIRALLATMLLVDDAPATISGVVYDDDNLIAWTQNGVDYEATYDVDGNLLTQGPA